MSRPEARTLLLAMLASCALLPACEESTPGEGANGPPAGAASQAPKAVDLGAQMVAAVAPGSSAGVIGVHFALTKAPMLNEALPMDIAIVPHREFTSVAVHFFSQDGLTLVSGDVLGPVTDAKLEKPIKHQLVLMPAREGLYMISATVETTGADGTVSRVFSIPVVVAAHMPDAPAAAVVPPAAPASANR